MLYIIGLDGVCYAECELIQRWNLKITVQSLCICFALEFVLSMHNTKIHISYRKDVSHHAECTEPEAVAAAEIAH